MYGADSLSTFQIDLPDQDAALALAGEAESTLHRLEALTGASLVLRGLCLHPPSLVKPMITSGRARSSHPSIIIFFTRCIMFRAG